MKRFTVLLAALALTGLAGCAQNPGGTPPSSWMAAGCYDSSFPGQADEYYSGTQDTFHNSAGYSSQDGSCTGTVLGLATIVDAPDSPTALTLCQTINPGFTTAGRLNADFDFATAPVDAWACIPNL